MEYLIQTFVKNNAKKKSFLFNKKHPNICSR